VAPRVISPRCRTLLRAIDRDATDTLLIAADIQARQAARAHEEDALEDDWPSSRPTAMSQKTAEYAESVGGSGGGAGEGRTPDLLIAKKDRQRHAGGGHEYLA
jgi:hypothetical protein